MALTPPLRLDWLNGWVLFAVFCAAEGLLVAPLPRAVVKRLFDRSGWSPRQRAFTAAGKLFSLASIVVLVLSPLKVGTGVFIAGICVMALGIGMLVAAVVRFARTPLDAPVTGGLYRISRHPQIIALFVSFVGMGLAVGSWLVLLLLLVSRVLQHWSILAEEKVCLEAYGEPYRAYLERVPRYFVAF